MYTKTRPKSPWKNLKGRPICSLNLDFSRPRDEDAFSCSSRKQLKVQDDNFTPFSSSYHWLYLSLLYLESSLIKLPSTDHGNGNDNGTSCLISLMRTNKRAARAARFLEQIFSLISKTNVKLPHQEAFKLHSGCLTETTTSTATRTSTIFVFEYKKFSSFAR